MPRRNNRRGDPRKAKRHRKHYNVPITHGDRARRNRKRNRNTRDSRA